MSKPAESSLLLASALTAADFHRLAERASNNEFHDFLSPHAMPNLHLVAELRAIPGGGKRAEELIQRVIDGHFDATRSESDEWAKSPEGKAAFKELGL